MPTSFSRTYLEAEKRYERWKNADPFPNIAPALLNSADIKDYIRETGMIYPFHEENLAGATYEVNLKGLCVRYAMDESKNGQIGGTSQEICETFRIGSDPDDLPNAKRNEKDFPELRDELVLEPNSITFVTLEPVFQIPNYMALRFNLRIKHVYKGLLLGTGPIIDPGFKGRLSIPLHNLTSNKYVFSVDEPMIVLEFTKMSPIKGWREWADSTDRKTAKTHCSNYPQSLANYKPTGIPANRQVDDYIFNALKKSEKKAIVSSVSTSMQEAVTAAKNAEIAANSAKKDAEDAKSVIFRIGVIGIASLVVAIIALVLPTYQLIKAVDDTQASYSEKIVYLQHLLDQKERELQDLSNDFEELKRKVYDSELTISLSAEGDNGDISSSNSSEVPLDDDMEVRNED